MGYDVLLGSKIIGSLGLDNKVTYDDNKINSAITEMVAGQPAGGKFYTTAKVVYRWDSSRKMNNEAVFALWKLNPILQNRITQLNALIFGRGLKWIYEAKTQELVDRFWRVNRLRAKLNSISTDSQLYGEVFLGFYPQASGDVLMSIYESNQVDVDFDPGDIYNINKYIVTYKNEESGKDEQFDMQPIEKYLNEIEFANVINMATTTKIRKQLGMNGAASVKGKGVMAHIKFNNASSEIYGTSDFKQIFDIVSDYMNFVGDRLTIHQLYGSPAYDIEIDTDNPEDIKNRITELAGFTIGSNPVHNKQETWKPLEFTHSGISAEGDEKVLRGLLCAGTSFPEYLLFNQSEPSGDDNTFAITKLAEDRQDTFMDAIRDIHKFVVAVAGGDPMLVDDGQILFPEINTMSEKSKAETYVLKVGSKICSRRTASLSMGHTWELEEKQIMIEEAMLGELLGNNSDAAGAMGGRFTSRINNQDKNRDDGTKDREDRANATNITTPITTSTEKPVRNGTSGG